MITQSYDLDWMISVDDHIIEPGGVWQDRVPARYREAAPRLVTEHDGSEYWIYEDARVPTGGLNAAAGLPPEEMTADGYPYSAMRPGYYDARARLADMTEAGVLASLNFPSFPRFCGQRFAHAKDKDLALLCVRAYNDWMLDEWCATDPGRFIPLAIVPVWDVKLALAELHRVHGKGVRSICFSENFAPLGLPTIHTGYWDPLLDAVNELGVVLSIHIGSSSTVHRISDDSPTMANFALGMVRPADCLMDWIFSGKFQHFAKLKIALSEGSIGWVPYVLERAEQVYRTQRHWVKKGIKNHLSPKGDTDARIDHDAIDVYRDYREHFFGCVIDDATGLRMLDVIGEDNVMVESDYPHSDSTWPNSLRITRDRFDAAGLSPDVQYKLLRGNAERLYRFTPAPPHGVGAAR